MTEQAHVSEVVEIEKNVRDRTERVSDMVGREEAVVEGDAINGDAGYD